LAEEDALGDRVFLQTPKNNARPAATSTSGDAFIIGCGTKVRVWVRPSWGRS